MSPDGATEAPPNREFRSGFPPATGKNGRPQAPVGFG